MAYTIGIDLTFIKDIAKAVGPEMAALSIIDGLYSYTANNDFIVFVRPEHESHVKYSYPLFNIATYDHSGKFYYRFLPKFLKRTRIDVMFYPCYCKKLNFRLKAPIVVTSHGFTKGEDFFIIDKLRSSRVKKKVNIVAVSDYVKKELIKKRKINADKITVIPNPLVYMNRSVDIVFKKKHIVAVGNDKPQKNIMMIVKAFEKLVPIIEHDLILIGDISEKGEIFKYVIDSKISNRVIMTGNVSRDTLFGYFKNTDLFVNASVFEGFGMAPLEAMVFKAPVVSTPIPSISEIGSVEFDEQIDYDSDETEIANKMLSVLKRTPDEKSAEQRAQKIMEYYSPHNISRKYMKVFENV